MSDAEPFRMRNKDDPMGKIHIAKALRASVYYGEFQFMWILPHLLIPIYGIYRVLCQKGLWPTQLAPLGELGLAIAQGAGLGGMIVFGYFRWSRAGRALMGRREAGTAGPGETRAQKKIQLGFAISTYVLFITFCWLVLPPADGPKTAAAKATARKWGFDPSKIFS